MSGATAAPAICRKRVVRTRCEAQGAAKAASRWLRWRVRQLLIGALLLLLRLLLLLLLGMQMWLLLRIVALLLLLLLLLLLVRLHNRRPKTASR